MFLDKSKYLALFFERAERTIVITTLVCDGFATKSIAPPMPFTLPGSMKFAKSGL